MSKGFAHPTTRHCVLCGIEYTSLTKVGKFCRTPCGKMHDFWIVKCPCGKHLSSRREAYCSAACSLKYGVSRGPFTCQKCGVVYHTKRSDGQGQQYCSRECGWQDTRRLSDDPSVCVPRQCRVCEKWMASRFVCGDECEREWNRRTYKRHDPIEYRRKHKPVVCRGCGSVFTPLKGARVWCSTKCQSKGYNDSRVRSMRREGARVDQINRFDVFVAARWRCALCGIAVTRTHRNADDSPELDHIVPLSKGGGHTHDNVQLLCRRCNNVKGARLPSVASLG